MFCLGFWTPITSSLQLSAAGSVTGSDRPRAAVITMPAYIEKKYFRVRHLAIDNMVSGNAGLCQLAERDRFSAGQGREARVVRVPAAKLIFGLAHAGIVLTPPRFFPAIIHTIANGPGYGDLARQAFASGLPPQSAYEDVSVLFSCGHHFSPGEKNHSKAANTCWLLRCLAPKRRFQMLPAWQPRDTKCYCTGLVFYDKHLQWKCSNVHQVHHYINFIVYFIHDAC